MSTSIKIRTASDEVIDLAGNRCESDFRSWKADNMESHGMKAAYFAGWRDALSFYRPAIDRRMEESE
jgi:hypothetical protein